jgi:nucleoside-diphosphate-sugar epimerase
MAHSASDATGRPMRPVIVTGAGGFVGSHVMRALLVSGRRVVATDLAPEPPAPALAGLDRAALTYVSGDLRHDTTLDALASAAEGPVDVVHVAALIQLGQLGSSLGHAGATPSNALTALEVNAMASWGLCTRLLEAGSLARFLHVSTRSVFGGRPATDSPIDDDSPPQPAGIYGSSKAAAELGLLALRTQFGLDLVIARITGVFGPWQGPASFIGQAMDAVLHGRAHRADTGGDDAYELTYVKDTVRGLMALLDPPALQHSVYHVASGDRLVKLSEVAAAFRAADPSVDVHFGPGAHSAALGRTPLRVDRIRDEVGFATRWPLDTAIADYLRVERSGSYGTEASDAVVEHDARIDR